MKTGKVKKLIDLMIFSTVIWILFALAARFILFGNPSVKLWWYFVYSAGVIGPIECFTVLLEDLTKYKKILLLVITGLALFTSASFLGWKIFGKETSFLPYLLVPSLFAFEEPRKKGWKQYGRQSQTEAIVKKCVIIIVIIIIWNLLVPAIRFLIRYSTTTELWRYFTYGAIVTGIFLCIVKLLENFERYKRVLFLIISGLALFTPCVLLGRRMFERNWPSLSLYIILFLFLVFEKPCRKMIRKCYSREDNRR